MLDKDEKLIVRMRFGSHLYGTATEDSDLDFKGIFLPTRSQVFLGNIPKCYNQTTKKGTKKNSSEDVDEEIFSLHYFIKLACEGQTVALDMLHAPEDALLVSTPIWKELVSKRDKFYTKNLKAFVSYARKQAAKYSLRGSRLDTAKKVITFLSHFEDDTKLDYIWEQLPQGEYINFIGKDKDGIELYQVVGKKFQITSKVGYVRPILQKFYDEYGKRAKLAAENKGIDWKSISHALRAAYQTKQILTKGTIEFPLRRAPYLLDVKLGKKDYTTEVVPELERVMDEIEILSTESTLPEKVDKKFWDEWLIDVVHSFIR